MNLTKIKKKRSVANQQSRSKDQTSMLNTTTATVPTPSRPLLAPPKIINTYSMSSTNNNPLQTLTNLKSTTNLCQTLYQTHTAPNIGHSKTLL